MAEAHKCPVCGEYTFEEWNSLEICEVCGWQDDAVQQNKPSYRGGANTMSLDEAKAAYQDGKPVY